MKYEIKTILQLFQSPEKRPMCLVDTNFIFGEIYTSHKDKDWVLKSCRRLDELKSSGVLFFV